MFTPYEWQIKDQDMLRAHDWTGAVVIEPGGGKTTTASLATRDSGADVKLIVAPQGTHKGHGDGYEWHIQELAGEQLRFLNNKDKAGQAAFSDIRFGVPGFYIITPQLFVRTDWAGVSLDMTVVDEVHLLAQGAKSKKKLTTLKSGARIAMSGTPTRNKFQNWWTVMRFLYPEMDGFEQIADRSHYRWMDYRMVSEYDHFAPRNTKYLREKIPGQLANEIPCYIQHFRRAKCCAHHPNGFLTTKEPVPIREVVELLPAQKRAISQLEEQSIAWLDGNPMIADLDITTRLRIRQITLGVPTMVPDETGALSVEFEVDTPSPKLDRAIEIIEGLDGDAAIVFTSSQRFARVAVQRFSSAGFPAFEWSGKIGQGQRDEYMRDFQAGKYQVGVVVIAAGGTGVGGFSKRAATEIWLDRDLDGTSNYQGECRLDRMGQTRPVQRFLIQDDQGRDEGALSAQLLKRLELNASNRRRV